MSIRNQTSVLELVINGKQAQTSMNGLTNSIRNAEREFRRMREADDPRAYAEAARNIRIQREALNEMRRSISGVNQETENFKTGWKEIAKGIVAGFGVQEAIQMVVNLGKQVFEITAKFQKLEAVLTTTLGSRSQAKIAMQQIQQFASETPFAVDELTDAYVKLANQGFKPTKEQMRSLGDLAASTGKSFDQLTEAIIDAQVGEFERLKEFGIRAKKEGDNVSFTFKGVTQTVKNTEDSIRGYITSLGDLEGVSGSMAGISETLTGKVSNLGDAWDQLLVTVGEETAGVFSSAISIMSEAISDIDTYLKKLNLAQKYNAEGSSFWSRLAEQGSRMIIGANITSSEIKRDAFAQVSNDLDKQIGEAKYFKDLLAIQDDLRERMSRVDKSTQQGSSAWNLYKDKLTMVKDAYEGLKKQRIDEATKKQTDAQREANKEAEKASKLAEKLSEQERKRREKDLESLKNDLEKEFQALDLSNMEGLSKVLGEITAKYNPLIEKAKKLNDLDLLNQANLLKETAKKEAVATFSKEDAEKQRKQDYADANKALTDSYASQKVGITNDATLTPEQRQQAEYDLETQRLTALYVLNEAFGESSIEYEQALADRKLAIREQEFENKQKLAEAEAEIQRATLDTAGQGIEALKGMVNQQSILYKGLIIAEKAVAIATVIVNTQKEIAGYYAAYAAIPGGVAVASTLAGIAKVRAGVSIATIAATGFKELKSSNKKANGGFMPNGPSHSQGGMAVLDANGNPVAEIEGGEPILSRETYRNNKETIDALLYSSQRMNGARLRFNNKEAIRAERYFRSGGVIGAPQVTNNSTVTNNANVDMSPVVDAIKSLEAKIKDQKVINSLRTFHEDNNKYLQASFDASA